MATEKSIYELSDEEFMNLDPSLAEEPEAPAAEEEPAVEDPEPTAAEEDPENDEPAAEDPEPEEGEDPEADPEAEQEPAEEDPAAGQGSDDGEDPEAEAPAKEEEDKPKEGDEPKIEEPDYKATHDRLMAPFKANGKEMKVENVDEAITLMQMGANYNKKMAGLKPHLKLMKMLENEGLLSEEKLSYLIDLEKKNPAAIQKLVKDSGVDPLEMDEDKSEYKPGTYTVDDKEIELDHVLDKIQDTPTYQKTINVVSTKWDGPSKQAIANTPQLLEVINDHMGRGIYDVINTEVERGRTLGRLDGLSDLEAYQKVGDALHKSGGFDHLVQATPAPTPASAPRREVTPRKDKQPDPARSDKRRAASPTRTEAPGTKPAGDFNPLALSDEEFEKHTNSRLM
ncbi:MAG TPA: hypothetical protein VIG24_11985 [Acidimicrobiia bacterium]